MWPFLLLFTSIICQVSLKSKIISLVTNNLLLFIAKRGNQWRYLWSTIMGVPFSVFYQLQLPLNLVYLIATSTHLMIFWLANYVQHMGNVSVFRLITSLICPYPTVVFYFYVDDINFLNHSYFIEDSILLLNSICGMHLIICC